LSRCLIGLATRLSYLGQGTMTCERPGIDSSQRLTRLRVASLCPQKQKRPVNLTANRANSFGSGVWI
jgi:hypothetical protein